MSFKKSGSKIKSFVTEDEAQDINEERQKEWERVRQPDDPLECPDVEPRSLFEQLQEQKEKVQQDHDEKYNIKNMFRGIDNDEAAFLEFASKQQAEIDRRRFAVTAEVEEYRNEVAKLQTTVDPVSASEDKEKKKQSVVSQGKKRSQVELLAGCIKTKRKRSEADSGEEEKPGNKSTDCADKNPVEPSEEQKQDVNKEPCVEEKQEDSSFETHERSDSSEEPSVVHDAATGYPVAAGYIPSLGVYSDSSDSESSSSDSDILPSLFSFSSKAK